ncbi:MAG: tetratricopeptide repeat protein [Bacteroidota bacterium]|nr:tetratricopeptide repeat protein [Bacteroidota bacterium]MDP4273986.1 tetratricopeptide repeat protein [Bacteroidota bacterium]
MKKILTGILFFSSFLCAMGQQFTSPDALDYSSLEKKYNKSNEAMQNPKQNVKVKTWIERADLLQKIGEVNVQYLRFGMSSSELKLLFKDPQEIKHDTTGKEIYVYPRVNVIFENKALKSWKVTKNIVEDPLQQSFDTYKKAMDMDKEGKETKKFSENLKKLKSQFENDGISEFNQDNYDQAMKDFENVLEIGHLPIFKTFTDTSLLYNAGLAAYSAKNYEKALQYYSQAKDYKYGGANTYIYLKNAYLCLHDTAKALSILKDGFQAYPGNNAILIEMINFYLVSGESQQALDYLKLAKEKDPKNQSFYFAEGTLYEKLKEPAKAEESYKQAIEVKPDYFDAYYNLGALHYNQAVEIFKAAGDIPLSETAKYNAQVEKANSCLKDALPFMEKAHEINPKDINTIQTLQTLYAKLQNFDKMKEMKALLDNLKK